MGARGWTGTAVRNATVWASAAVAGSAVWAVLVRAGSAAVTQSNATVATVVSKAGLARRCRVWRRGSQWLGGRDMTVSRLNARTGVSRRPGLEARRSRAAMATLSVDKIRHDSPIVNRFDLLNVLRRSSRSLRCRSRRREPWCHVHGRSVPKAVGGNSRAVRRLGVTGHSAAKGRRAIPGGTPPRSPRSAACRWGRIRTRRRSPRWRHRWPWSHPLARQRP